MTRSWVMAAALAVVAALVLGLAVHAASALTGGTKAAPIPSGLVLYERRSERGSWIEVRDLRAGSRHALTPRLEAGETRRDHDATWSPTAERLHSFARRGSTRLSIWLTRTVRISAGSSPWQVLCRWQRKGSEK